MSILDTSTADVRTGSVTQRFSELADRLNAYFQKFREFGIRSNRAVAQYLCVDSAELSRLKNARVGDINLQRGYEILRKCEELVRRLSKFGGPMKCKDVYSVGFNITALPAISTRERMHAVSLQQHTDSVLLTVDNDAQRRELDVLLGEVIRSVVHPKRNPYGPMSIMYVLKSIYAAPASTREHLLVGLRAVPLGVRACSRLCYNDGFGEESRLRTLAVTLNNGGGIALRLSKEHPQPHDRMLKLAACLHRRSLETFYFAGTLRGALTCANDLRDDAWAENLLNLLVEREGASPAQWPRGIVADIDDSGEWQYLKAQSFWNLLDGLGKAAQSRES